MDVILQARELGKALQQDAAYVNVMAANDACDACKGLQERIEKFNELRAEINKEIMSEEKDTDRIQKMDADLKAEYTAIMEVPEMVAFNEAKATFDDLIGFINKIVGESAGGADPATVEKEDGCGGSCSSCSGCH